MARENKEHSIRAAALRLLEKGGPEAVTMRRVAQAAGVTAMAIYHYFPSREALLDRITKDEFEAFAAALVLIPRGGTLEARLERHLDRFLDFALRRPRVYDYVFSAPRPGARRFPSDFQAGRSPTCNVIVSMVEEGMQSRYLRKGPAHEVALTMMAHTQGMISLYRGGRFAVSEREFRRVCKRSWKRVLDGLRQTRH